MKSLCLVIFAISTAISLACRPAAAPVAVSNRPTSVNEVKVTKPWSETSWTKEDGTEQTFNDLKGKAVILDFWATYCGPCRDEIPHLNQLQAKYSGNLEVIGMHSGGDEDRPKIAEFRKEIPMDYRLAYPDDDMLDIVFHNDDRIPQTMVFDRNGRLVHKIVGFDKSIMNELDAAVRQAIAQ
jgi:thiol-disulfide isomerase/thioredoxin